MSLESIDACLLTKVPQLDVRIDCTRHYHIVVRPNLKSWTTSQMTIQLWNSFVCCRVPVRNRTTMSTDKNIPALIPINPHCRYFCVIVAKVLNRFRIFKIEKLCRWLICSTRNFEVIRTHSSYIDLTIVVQFRYFVRNYLLIYLTSN